jgi:hypothetical protein
MNDDQPISAPPVARGVPATSQGLPFSKALILTILFAIVTVGGSYGVLKSTFSTSTKAAFSITTLVALIGLGYSGFQLLMALIATTGERRWFTREVSERRTGDRARQPRDR